MKIFFIFVSVFITFWLIGTSWCWLADLHPSAEAQAGWVFVDLFLAAIWAVFVGLFESN